MKMWDEGMNQGRGAQQIQCTTQAVTQRTDK